MTKGGVSYSVGRESSKVDWRILMTQHNVVGNKLVEDEAGLAAYGMDLHHIERVVVKERNGVAQVKNEGDIQVHGFSPYPISYRSLTPKREECEIFCACLRGSAKIKRGSFCLMALQLIMLNYKFR